MAAHALLCFWHACLALHSCTPGTVGTAQAQGELCSGLFWELGVAAMFIHQQHRPNLSSDTDRTEKLIVSDVEVLHRCLALEFLSE